MVDGLTTTIIVTALVVAGFSGLMMLLNQPPRFPHLVGLALLEVLLLVQAVVAMGKMLTGDQPDGLATFVGYLLVAVLIPPVATLFGWAESNRWGSGLIAVACLVVPAMVVRLQQVWHG